MISVIFFAASVAGYVNLDTGAAACLADSQRTRAGFVYKLEFDGAGDELRKCCSFMGTSFKERVCLDQPLEYGCDYRPRLTRMRCQAAPSFEAVPL